MTGADADKRRRDASASGSAMAERWMQRKRTNASQAFRYTRFVAVMRRLLPTAAIAVLGVVLAYALYPRDKERMSLSYEQAQGVAGDLSMTKPRLSGTDVKGNPYVITADFAVQTEKNARKVLLTNVDADMQFDGKRWANAKSGKGFVDMDAKKLDLSQNISLYTDDGYEFHTPSANVDLDRNIATGNERVRGQGPMGSFAADSFVFDRANRHVTLKGRVQTVLYPKQGKIHKMLTSKR